MSKVVIIDLDSGNLHSVNKAIQHISPKSDVIISRDKKQILSADRIILPGQGSFNAWMLQVKKFDLEATVDDMLKNKLVMGICVGMQALFEHSEEGDCKGLGLFKGKLRRFKADPQQGLNVPQMGWNRVHQESSHALWRDIPLLSWYYFAHSYYVEGASEKDILGVTEYGLKYPVAVANDNVMAVQFHPEKSQQHGLQLFKNFIDWQA